MRTIHIKSIIILVIIILSVVISVNGQPLPTQHGGGGGTWVGDSAPLPSAPFLMILFGSVYALIKYRIMKKKFKDNDQ